MSFTPKKCGKTSKILKVLSLTPVTFRGRTIRPPGRRILKTTLAVFLCLIYGYFRDSDSAIFFAAVAAVFGLRPDLKTTWASLLDRLVGTGVGALLGLLAIELQQIFHLPQRSLPYYLLVTLLTFINLWLIANIFRPGGMIVSCVVLFSIAINYAAEMSAVQYVAFRFIDTAVGLLISLFINLAWPPKRSFVEAEATGAGQDRSSIP